MTHHETKKIQKISKSTNVRTLFVQHGLHALQAIDTSLAAMVMEDLFRRAKRHPTPPREKHWMRGADSYELRDGKRRIAAWSWGQGPTVLLAHGWAGRGSQLGAFVGPLVERGFRVVTWDVPGHGASSGKLTSIPAFRDALLQVAKAEAVIHGVVAHSAGSVGATLACHRGLEVDRLVYLAPVLDPGAFLPQITDSLGLRPEVATLVRPESSAG
jgi:alpha-beta hydrolase superfamily lysophospholipase